MLTGKRSFSHFLFAKLKIGNRNIRLGSFPISYFTVVKGESELTVVTLIWYTRV